MLILEVLFAVFMVLWLASSGGVLGDSRYSGLLPWLCVALLAAMTHVVHL